MQRDAELVKRLGITDMWDYEQTFEQLNRQEIKVKNKVINNESIKTYIKQVFEPNSG